MQLQLVTKQKTPGCMHFNFLLLIFLPLSLVILMPDIDVCGNQKKIARQHCYTVWHLVLNSASLQQARYCCSWWPGMHFGPKLYSMKLAVKLEFAWKKWNCNHTNVWLIQKRQTSLHGGFWKGYRHDSFVAWDLQSNANVMQGWDTC